MVPRNVNLIKYPIFLIGGRSELMHSVIGELDHVYDGELTPECFLLDPVFPLPIIHVDSTRRRHNIDDLLEMTSETTQSSANGLR
jgi:hypothetical protein